MKLFEQKAHKKALKAADRLHKDFPLHPGTMAMKGLLLALDVAPDKTEEGLALCEEARRLDPNDYQVLQVCGLFHRSQKNNREAIKCYTASLRVKPDNQQVRPSGHGKK